MLDLASTLYLLAFFISCSRRIRPGQYVRPSTIHFQMLAAFFRCTSLYQRMLADAVFCGLSKRSTQGYNLSNVGCWLGSCNVVLLSLENPGIPNWNSKRLLRPSPLYIYSFKMLIAFATESNCFSIVFRRSRIPACIFVSLLSEFPKTPQADPGFCNFSVFRDF